MEYLIGTKRFFISCFYTVLALRALSVSMNEQVTIYHVSVPIRISESSALSRTQ